MKHSDPAFPTKLDGFPDGSLPSQLQGLQSTPRHWPLTKAEAKSSAILLLFVPPGPGQGPARILLTRRSTQLRSHRGQIGLPGGRREDTDEGPTQTALRETDEELGIPAERVQILGSLPPIRSLDGSLVIPVVGTTTVDISELRLAPSEVADAFALEWTFFTPDKYHSFSMTILGIRRHTGVFFAEKFKIWGLTAHVLCTAQIG